MYELTERLYVLDLPMGMGTELMRIGKDGTFDVYILFLWKYSFFFLQSRKIF